MRVALYALVSTADKDLENQLTLLRRREGYVHGRRALAPTVVKKNRALQQEGLCMYKISAAVGVPVGTMHKYPVKPMMKVV